MSECRLEILKKIETGELSAEEGFRLISLIEGETAESVPQSASAAQETPPPERLTQAQVVSHPQPLPDFNRWKIWSWVGFGIFLLLTAASAVWMIQGWTARSWGWGFWLSWIPFLIGVAGMALMFNTRWLHVRVRNDSGEKHERVAVSIPFPLGLVSWLFRTFPQWIPEKAGGANIAEIIDEMNASLSKDEPLVVEVDDEDGEHVEIYIG